MSLKPTPAELAAAVAHVEYSIDCGAFTSNDVPHLRVLPAAAELALEPRQTIIKQMTVVGPGAIGIDLG